ncbi:MAG TPA: prepilin-type N-terminal cleavage/methylation domain-containing protein [bacterium]|nr:prepilin-type N-terminal cleavage/methylation domain-containing protein [bacterium]HQL63090.1 prepilin-type N-terminal cleavage/methylation domain-containing protein [bacterium]
MSRRTGFTLIELLIVVAIIGILAAIAVPNFMNARTRAAVARVIADMRNLGVALEQYALDNGNRYPYTAETAETEYKPLRKLTTPVPYMSALPPRDPFLPKDSASETPGGTRDSWWDPYWLATFPTECYYGVSNPDIACYQVGLLRYILASVGPDKFFNGTPFSGFATRDFYWVPYTPSNGLVSIGDLFYYGPGGTTSDNAKDHRR